MSDGVTAMQTIARTDVEDFLFAEAELLDEWRLPEWLELFTDDAIYYVPATDLAVDASPDNNLFYVADDRFRLSERVKRLMKRTAHAEFPHSRTRHLVSNVRIRKHIGDDIEVSSASANRKSSTSVRAMACIAVTPSLMPAP